MSLQRLRSPYTSQTSVGTGFVGPAAEFSDGAGDLFSIHEFEGDGTGGTNAGQMYKVFQWKNTVDNTNYQAWRDDPTTYLGGNGSIKCTVGGYADILVCAAGGCGGGAHTTSGAGAGAGGGGVIVKFNIKFDASPEIPYTIFAGAASQKASITNAQGEKGQPSWVHRPDGSTMYEAFGGAPGQTAPTNTFGEAPYGSGGGNSDSQGDNPGSLFAPYEGVWTPGQGHKGGSGSYTSQGSGGGGGFMGPAGNGGRGTSTAANPNLDNVAGNGGDGLVIRFNGAENHHGYGPGGGGAAYGTTNGNYIGKGGAGGGINGRRGSNGELLNTTESYGFGAGGGGASRAGAAGNFRGETGTAGIVMIRIPI